jgi:hypothetical protein
MWQDLNEGYKVNFELMQIITVSNNILDIQRKITAHGVNWTAVQRSGKALAPFMTILMFETKLELMYLSWVLEKDLLA